MLEPPESPDSMPQQPESPELSALLGAMNHMLPASDATARILALEATLELASITMDEIHG